MDAKDVITTHPQDDAHQAKARHEQIVKRLDELGAPQVRSLMGHGLPTNWDPIILAWLKDR